MTNELTTIANWISGTEAAPRGDQWLEKFDPHSGAVLVKFADSSALDVSAAIGSAEASFLAWSELTPVKRGQILSEFLVKLTAGAAQLAECIAKETGKPPQDARGEVAGALQLGAYFAGEGMRLYARSLTSGTLGKQSFTIRQARGVAGLIVPANTPIANIAWKVFPALICGNTVVLKASEDAPSIALLFARIAKAAGLPDGVLNVIQGRGDPAGKALVADERVSVISFTGSTAVGRSIASVAGQRLARVSLELGGKNPFVVCDDADLERAVHWAALSAFSNAGQRCAAGSRVIVFQQVYEQFRDQLVARARSLRLGVGEGCDLGPVIHIRQQRAILEAIKGAVAEGGRVLCGGTAPADPELASGCYIEPTVIEGLSPRAKLSCSEIFGPVVTLHPVPDLASALELANATEYGLTAAIHTRSVDRALWFSRRVRAGVANVNLGTYGSEPHMPFGGFGASGNGTREPGVEALDVYSELKNISILERAECL